MMRLMVDAARLRVALVLPARRADAREIADRYAPFDSACRPEWTLRLAWGAADLGASWSPRVSNGGPGLHCRARLFRWKMRLDQGRGDGVARPTPQAVDGALRAVWSALLPRQGGCLLHAAAVRWRGRAWLLAGPSGAGKTSIAGALRRVPGVRVLSDELTAIREGPGGPWAWSTPFWGEFRQPENGGGERLARVFVLAKGRSSSVEPLSRAEAERMLLRCLVTFETSRVAVSAAWDALSRAARLAPAVLRWRLGEDPRVLLDLMSRLGRRGGVVPGAMREAGFPA